MIRRSLRTIAIVPILQAGRQSELTAASGQAQGEMYHTMCAARAWTPHVITDTGPPALPLFTALPRVYQTPWLAVTLVGFAVLLAVLRHRARVRQLSVS